MLERVVVLQSRQNETIFWAPDPQDPASDAFLPIEQISSLTSREMLLAGLGASAATELNSYAREHGLGLQHVELRLQYAENGKREGRIEEEIVLYGSLSREEHRQLLASVNRCAVHRMLQRGMQVESLLADDVR